jgi:hypothetical protein
MSIHLLHTLATTQQVAEMLEELGVYIKLAVDVRRGVVAGGGELHADCEKVLEEDGSQPADIWGADWYPALQAVKFEALINLWPRRNNPSMEILNPAIRAQVEAIVRQVLEGVT